MTKVRKYFISIWCVLSIVGIIFPDVSSSYIGFFLLGFHTPRDSMFYFMLYAKFSNYPKLALISIPFFAFFVICWIVALIRIKKGKFFEHLIIADNIIALCRVVTCAFVLKDDFDGWIILVGLVIVNIFCIGAFILNYILQQTRDSKSNYI